MNKVRRNELRLMTREEVILRIQRSLSGKNPDDDAEIRTVDAEAKRIIKTIKEMPKLT